MLLKRKVHVAVDAMGGDYAPGEIVKGALWAAQKSDVEITLVGSLQMVGKELSGLGGVDGLPIHVVDAKDSVGEHDSPAVVIRRKSNSSIAVGAKLVKQGKVDGLVSAGSTGASLVSAVQFIGMLDGMSRPAIAAPLGGFAHDVLLMDAGANVDCKPYQLLSFAVAGAVCAEKMLRIPNPTIALLSTGAEESKGSEAVRESYQLFKDSGLNFIGNIEGHDILSGRANVVICDGLVGNILLKFYESIGGYAKDWIKRKLKRQPPLKAITEFFFSRLFPIAQVSYEGEDEAGGLLWGINGIVRIGHGASRAEHVVHAINSVKNAVEADIVGSLKAELGKLKQQGKL